MIIRRANMARMIAMESSRAGWAEEDARMAREFHDRADVAREQCSASLPKILRDRSRNQSKTLPRWLEQSPGFMCYAHPRIEAAGPSSRLALHLSNLQELNFNGFPYAEPPEKARPFYDMMHRGKAKCEEAIRSFTGKSLMLWAPTDNATVVHLASAFRALAVSSERDLTLHLVVPHDPYPGCDQLESILDLWWHGLLADKWRSMVKSIEFFRQPARCVFSGRTRPQRLEASPRWIPVSRPARPSPRS